MFATICSFTKNDPLCMAYHPYNFVGEVLLQPVFSLKEERLHRKEKEKHHSSVNMPCKPKVPNLKMFVWIHSTTPPILSVKFWDILYIQGVTGPHRQNDRDDRPCRENDFL